MRTIKFRGQRDNGEFVVGRYCVFPDGTHRIAVTSETGMAWYTVKPETVGQYIGIEDTANDEIYEGMQIVIIGSHDALHTWRVEGTVTFSGTSFGIWVNDVWYGFDDTQWDALKLKEL